MKRIVLALSAVAFLGIAGCGEPEQVVVSKQGKYQGKRDTPGAPWDNEPLAIGPKWTKGDRTSWENEIKNRQQGQNEYRRIGQ